ncbi:MAG: NAD-dependent epimerase/dehydratase family protein [Betaproteobacteria bacterium]|nr:NAD-dependent epimerase/dehydratase family protein [Betaproteobacteria bacterium]
MLVHQLESAISPKRVVVMGAGGFVGGAVAARLAREGVPVLGLGRAEVDLLAADASLRLASLLRPEDAFVAVSARAPCKNADMLVENMIMARAMVSALAQVPAAHVVNISSDAVYADSPGRLTESSCASPGSLHGAMHLAREVLFASEQKAPLALLRPSLLYGAADPHNGYGPNRFRRQAARGEDIVLFGEGEERRDHVYIDDVAEIVARVLFRRSTGVLNIATGEVHSFRAIAETVVKLAGKPVAIKGSPRSGPMPHGGYRPFDIAACRAAFPDFRYTPVDRGLALAQTMEKL